MKKSLYMAAFFIFVFAFMYFIPSVFALTPGDVGQQVIDVYTDFFEPILAALFGGWDLGGLFLFEKFLLFVMLVGVIFVILKKVDVFKDNKPVIWIISLVIPLIGIRFVNIEQLNTILYSYTWLAITLTTILPLLIFFFFIYNIGGDHPILRKVLWGFLIAIYIGMFSLIENRVNSTIYGWTIVVLILLLIFDKKINRYFERAELKKANKNWKGIEVAKLRKDIDLAVGSGLPENRIKSIIKEKQKLIDELLKD